MKWEHRSVPERMADIVRWGYETENHPQKAEDGAVLLWTAPQCLMDNRYICVLAALYCEQAAGRKEETAMPAFFPDVLDDFLSPVFLERVCQKYHFTKDQMLQISAMAQNMLPYIREDAFWESGGLEENDPIPMIPDRVICESVVISLGNGLDALLEDYNNKEMLFEVYLADALAAELLLRGYDAYQRHIRKTKGRYVKAYHFPGSEAQFPIEMLPDLLKALTQKVTCNASYCMQPHNSVVFIAELTKDAGNACACICHGCSRTRCPSRTTNDRR